MRELKIKVSNYSYRDKKYLIKINSPLFRGVWVIKYSFFTYRNKVLDEGYLLDRYAENPKGLYKKLCRRASNRCCSYGELKGGNSL